MKIIKLIDGYVIYDSSDKPGRWSHLRHNYSKRSPLDFGYPVDSGNSLSSSKRIDRCDHCGVLTPPKVVVMFKLWCFQNNK